MDCRRALTLRSSCMLLSNRTLLENGDARAPVVPPSELSEPGIRSGFCMLIVVGVRVTLGSSIVLDRRSGFLPPALASVFAAFVARLEPCCVAGAV